MPWALVAHIHLAFRECLSGVLVYIAYPWYLRTEGTFGAKSAVQTLIVFAANLAVFHCTPEKLPTMA